VAASCIKRQAATSNNRFAGPAFHVLLMVQFKIERKESMSSLAPVAPTSKGMLRTGQIISGLIVAFLLVMASFGVLKPEMSRQGMRDMGYPESVGTPIGVVFIACVVLYAIPRTCVLGAILLTGYFGGAIATHVRLGQPTFVVALSIAVLAWLGIYLRDARLRALLPLRT
jgi:hypothetical protein